VPSFDIVSQVNSMEIENAVNQAKKELANRFDFKEAKRKSCSKRTRSSSRPKIGSKSPLCPKLLWGGWPNEY